MPSLDVDIVLVIDASGSMQPCFDGLRKHMKSILQPLQGQVSKVHFGLVAQSVGQTADANTLFRTIFLKGASEVFDALYLSEAPEQVSRRSFFTDDPSEIVDRLGSIEPEGDEEMLVALDIAADFPFGPISNTKRVIALFSDEPFEGGISSGEASAKLPELCKKLQSRHIQLFAAIPDGPAAQELAAVDRSEIELIQGSDGLKSVDFSKLLGQMGKSISVSALQASAEGSYKRGLFGQVQWGEGSGSFGKDHR